jgi:UDP-N-acetylmuramoyl-L-alanyl-D-glutamate--2,6-diaminopimelate ligase
MQADNHNILALLSFLGINIDKLNNCCPNLHYQNANQLTVDSRLANRNTVFMAVFGSQANGHDYLQNVATQRGILAFVETKLASEDGKVENMQFEKAHSLCCIYVHNLTIKLTDIAYCFYTGKVAAEQNLLTSQLPSITAITGTNGKTSVAALIAQLSSLCNKSSASIGTLGVNLFTHGQQEKLRETINTTPDTVSLISTLSLLSSLNCENVTLEASSHGLAQNRLNKLSIDCAVFTNLSQDHLDYHGSMASYGEAKRKLLAAHDCNIIVLNADDKESLLWQSDAQAQQAIYWFSLKPIGPKKYGCWASDVVYSTKGISFTLHAAFPDINSAEKIQVSLIGEFNLANLLASLTSLLAQGFLLNDLVQAIPDLSGVPGRMELFESAKGSVLVDYAHTPDALEQALLAARVHTKGTLTCIFGCGGNRDKGKRSLMGRVAQQYADHIVLTQDNSRNEEPASIIADIQKGISTLQKQQSLSVELNRALAIEQSLAASKVNDMILVAGKGHEDYIEIDSKRIAYNEREIVAALCKKMKNDNTNEKDAAHLEKIEQKGYPS